MASSVIKIFLLLCLTFCFIQAQGGRLGKPFYSCRSYIVAISFSFHSDELNPNPSANANANANAHVVTLENDMGKLGIVEFKQEKEPNQFFFESQEFIDNAYHNPSYNSKPYHAHNEHERHHKKVMMSNFQKRARDVLSILIALLLGALCGAITSTIFHVVWSIATHRYALFDDHHENDVGVEDPQDFGYQKLPTKEGVEKMPPTKEDVEAEAK